MRLLALKLLLSEMTYLMPDTFELNLSCGQRMQMDKVSLSLSLSRGWPIL